MRSRAVLICLSLTVLPWALACDEGITEPEEPDELCPPGQVVDTLFTPGGEPYFLLCDPPMPQMR